MEEKNLDATKEFSTEELRLVSQEIPEEEKELEIVTFDEAGDKKKKKEKDPNKKNPFKILWAKFKGLKTWIKVLIILGLIIFIAGISFLTYWLLNKNEKPKDKEKEKEEIVVKDNYRYENGTLYILDADDKVIGTYECNNKDENKCYVAYTLNDDNFNVPKKVFTDGTEYQQRSKVFHNRYVFIYDNKDQNNSVIILYDLQEKQEIDSYMGIKHYNTDNENILILKDKSSKYGLLELKEDGLTSVLENKYDYLGIIATRVTDDIVVSKEGNNWSLITFTGKTQAKNIEYEIKDYNDNFIVVSNNENMYLMDYTKKFVSSEAYLYIELLNEFNIFVSTDNKLYIQDKNGHKMNQEGITLFNNDYSKTLVFNEEGKQEETKFAYTYELINKKINFTISEDSKTNTKEINLMEGIISANYNFYSYFDGIIYFYKDGDKNNLIGQYACSNKNSVTDSTTDFDKCFLASDENHDDNDMVSSLKISSVIPIYNERFVFVRDAEKLADTDAKIKLYDIKSKKILASYVYVNTYSKENNTAIYHTNVTSQAVVAKLKNGKMGVITISNDSVGSLITFDYDLVEKLGNYFLVKKDNKWQIKENSTTNRSIEFSEQIRGYSGDYLKTKVNGKYIVYNRNNAAAIISGDLKYVEITNYAFAGVDTNNIVTLYRPDGTKIPIPDTLQLSSSEYYGTNNNAFTLTADASEVTVTILGTAAKTYDIATGTKKE